MERTIEPIQIKNFAVIPKTDGKKLTNSVNLDPQIIDKLTNMTEEESLVVLENNNGHLTQLSAERLLLFRALLPSRQEVLVSCPWAGLGEPGSADEQSVRPSAW